MLLSSAFDNRPAFTAWLARAFAFLAWAAFSIRGGGELEPSGSPMRQPWQVQPAWSQPVPDAWCCAQASPQN